MQIPTELVSGLGTYQLKSILGNDKGSTIYCAENSNGSSVVLVETDRLLPLQTKVKHEDAYKDRFYNEQRTKTFTVYGQEYLGIEGNDYFAYSTDEERSVRSRGSTDINEQNVRHEGPTDEQKQVDANREHICFNESAELKPCVNVLAKFKCKTGLRTPMMKVIPLEKQADENQDDDDEDDDEDDDDDDEDDDGDDDENETIEDTDEDVLQELPDANSKNAVKTIGAGAASILHRGVQTKASINISDNVRPSTSRKGKPRAMSLPRTPIPKVFPVSDDEEGSEDDDEISRSDSDNSEDEVSQLSAGINSKYSKKSYQADDEDQQKEEDEDDDGTSSGSLKGGITDTSEGINFVSAGIFLSEIPHKKPEESNFQVQHVDRVLDGPLYSSREYTSLENFRRDSATNNRMHPVQSTNSDSKQRSNSLSSNCCMEFNLRIDGSKMLSRRKTKLPL